MARFDPKMLVPALAADKGSAARSAKDVALANIAKMKEQYAAGEGAEGKVNFKSVDGGRLKRREIISRHLQAKAPGPRPWARRCKGPAGFPTGPSRAN